MHCGLCVSGPSYIIQDWTKIGPNVYRDWGTTTLINISVKLDWYFLGPFWIVGIENGGI